MSLACRSIFLCLFLTGVPALAQTPVIPTGHPRILLVGNEYLRLRNDLLAGTPAATRFRAMVDSALAGADIYGYEGWYSAMIGVLTGESKYCADAVSRTEADVAAEEALINAGQRADVAFDSYLYVGERIGNVALVYDWCWSSLTASQRTRWGNYASRAVANVWDPAAAQWGGVSYPWSGWSIDNPVNNYYYSFLRATMLLGVATKYDRVDADAWITRFRTTKIANQLVPIFNSDLVGGGSREGTGYGSAMRGLFNLYYLWEKSTGERIADLTPHTASSLPYFMHAILPSRDRFAPIGDHARDSTAVLYDYQREYLLALATLYRGNPLARRARAELAQSSVPEMSSGFNFVYDFLYDAVDTGSAANLNTLYRGIGTGHVFMRSDWNASATWLAQMTGPFTESHAHQDGLSLLLYKNGWLVSDANIDSHSGIVQGQEAHALVTQRVAGTLVPMVGIETSTANLTALSKRADYVYSAANAGTLFSDRYTGVSPVSAVRELLFIKPNLVVVFDRVRHLTATSTKTFQLPTPYLPTIAGRTATWSNGTSALKVHALSPAAATLSVTTMSTLDPDFNGGYRLDVTTTSAGESHFLNVLSIDNAATSVTGSASDDGMATIVLADGRTVIVNFTSGAAGGRIQIRSSGGQTLVDESFAGVVENIPLLLDGDFLDVPTGHWAYNYVHAIANAGITTGCGNGNYCPAQSVTRAQMAAFIVRALEGEPAANSCDAGSGFNDVVASNGMCRYIKRLAALGITTGCGGGNFCPDQTVTRQQAAAFIVRGKEGEPPLDTCASGSGFDDVASSDGMCRYIKRLAALGVTTGCGSGKFCPNGGVTRDQMAAFLARAFLALP